MKLEHSTGGKIPKRRGKSEPKFKGMDNPGQTIPKGNPVHPALYNGLTLDELIVKFQEFSDQYGDDVQYQSAGWGGVGTITFTPGGEILPLGFLHGIFELLAKYKVPASYSGIANFTGEEPFMQVTVKVPGTRYEDEKHG